MKLTVHVIKDSRAGYKHKSYMERHLFLGKTGVRNFCDRIDILYTSLPVFPPIHDTRMNKLTNDVKQAMLYDTLPHYYLKNMKEANAVPLGIALDELLSYALHIEEAAVNPGNDNKDNLNNSNNKKTKTTVPKKKGGGKLKKGGNKPILEGQERHTCIFNGKVGHT
jgi:hypothetical protein